jgi:uncharacterized protein
MLDKLPHFIDPITLADKQRVLIGQIPLTKLSRLTELLSDDQGQVEIDLFFSKEGRWSIVTGDIKAVLLLECRTCLETLTLPIEVKVNLAVVKSLEQVEHLAGKYEPLMLEDEKIPLHELVEDELLLALPAFPRHEQDCVPYRQSSGVIKSASRDDKQTQSNNPFSVLAQLKNIGD